MLAATTALYHARHAQHPAVDYAPLPESASEATASQSTIEALLERAARAKGWVAPARGPVKVERLRPALERRA